MNILVIKTKFIGDTILSSAFFEALKFIAPDAKVTAVLSPLTEQVLRHNPYIDRCYVTRCLDSHTKMSKKNRLLESCQLVNFIRVNNYQIVYILTRSFYSALLMLLARVPQRVGLSTDSRAFLLTHAVSEYADRLEHVNYLALLNALHPSDGKSSQPLQDDTLPAFNPKYFLNVGEALEAKVYLQTYFSKQFEIHKPIMFLHLSGTNALRRWRTEHWASLANGCADKGYVLIWSGVQADVHQMRDIQNLLTPLANHVSCLLPMLSGGGLLPIRELAALVSLCSATVSVDTGPMHLSAAIGVPTIGLFGPGDPARWQPVGYVKKTDGKDAFKHVALTSNDDLPCRPCHGKAGCERIQADSALPICMHNLDPNAVLSQLDLISHSI